MTHLQGRVERLEQQAGIANIDAGTLAVLDDADVTFYQSVMRRLARHPKGFESFIKTLADDEVERLAAVEVKLMDGGAPAELRDDWPLNAVWQSGL